MKRSNAILLAAAAGFALLLLAFTAYMGLSVRKLIEEEKLLAHRQLSSWVRQVDQRTAGPYSQESSARVISPPLWYD